MPNINHTLSDDLHRSLKVRAAREGVTLKQLVEQILRAAVAAEKPK